MGIANVRGKFTEFEGTLEMKRDLADGRTYGTVKVASIDTGEAQRDEHLRSADFFDAEQFPEITFESTRVEAIDDERTRVTGNLTMHGITREIVLEGLTPGHRHRPVGQYSRGRGGRRQAPALGLRHEVQPGAGLAATSSSATRSRSRSTSPPSFRRPDPRSVSARRRVNAFATRRQGDTQPARAGRVQLAGMAPLRAIVRSSPHRLRPGAHTTDASQPAFRPAHATDTHWAPARRRPRG